MMSTRPIEVNSSISSRHWCFSDASFYLWRRKFGGLDVPDAKRLRALEGENAKLKKMLAEAMLDIEGLKVVARGKF